MSRHLYPASWAPLHFAQRLTPSLAANQAPAPPHHLPPSSWPNIKLARICMQSKMVAREREREKPQRQP